jgi:hypothetical protein
MTTTLRQRKMLAAVGTFAVSLAAPALMFIGSGAAHADTNVCTPYDEGYSDGVFGGPGKCFADDSKQSQFNSGYLDGRAGRPSNPVNPFPITINPNLGLPQQSTMSPWDGRPGSSPEPPEFPEYHEPGERYEPAEEPWEQMEPPVIP